MINLDEYETIGARWIALYVNGNDLTTLIASELNIFQQKFVGNRNIITNIFRIQANHWVH